MTATFLLVPSPLVGPATWEPVGAELRQRGFGAIVAAPTPPVEAEQPWWSTAADEVVAATHDGLDAAAPDGGRVLGPSAVGFTDASRSVVILVGHSAAGARLPILADRLGRGGHEVAATVFVDAVLPAPHRVPADNVPPEFLAQLDALVDPDGMLPPWPEWWPPGTLAELVPDPDVRAAVAAECRRVPRALYEEPVPVPDGWPGDHPCGYLSFTYDREAAEAERRGWVVARMEGNHLQAVVDPGGVTDGLLLLLGALGARP